MKLYLQNVQKLHYLTNHNKSVVCTLRKLNGEQSFVFGTMIWLFLCRFLTCLQTNRIREIVLDTMQLRQVVSRGIIYQIKRSF